MAEFIWKDLVKKQGLADEYPCASCATSSEEIWGGVGNPVYPPARAILAEHGIDCGGKRAVRLTRADYQTHDYLVCMDGHNVRNALRLLGDDPEGKLCKLLDFTSRGGDVADPWYTGDFKTTYRDVTEGCEGLLAYLRERND